MQDNQYRAVRVEKLEKLKALGVEVYPAKARCADRIADLLTTHAEATAEALEAAPVQASTMGRVTAYRDSGKTCFLNLTQDGAKLQVYLRKDALSETDWEVVRLLDLGDFIAVAGTMMRTRTGELTLKGESLQFLTKALLPLPEKWHGLQDKEQRYRQRYLDLISNTEVLDTMRQRSRMISAVRRFMEGRGFLEVETPMMQPIPGGATARPFVTHHNALDMPLDLRIAPELYLKRLIMGGFEKVFEINRNFRNEGLSVRHNPEFTMMESYAAGEDLRDVMAMVEDMFHFVATEVFGAEQLPWGVDEAGEPRLISYAKPFRRMTMRDAIAEFGKVDRARLEDPAEIRKIAQGLHLEDTSRKSPGALIGELFEHLAEKQLWHPTFITEHPVELSPLTKSLPDVPGYVDRFELFVGGMELANAYSELNDPVVQLERFLDQAKERAGGNDEAMHLDQDFITALEHGFPPSGGLGVGMDRMAMLMTDSASIRDVILFPLMRPLKAQAEGEPAEG